MTNDLPVPSPTPNVIVANPIVRKIAGNTLAIATLVLAVATLVDGAIEAINYSAITAPAAIIIGGLLGIFQVSVTGPNVPTENVIARAEEARAEAYRYPGE